MFLRKYYSIMRREEEYRNRWAMGLAVTSSVLVLVSFAFYKGYLSFGNDKISSTNQVANVIAAEKMPSPVESTQQTFKTAFDEIGEKYQEFKDSISAVLVPFISNIEVYERK